MGFNLLKRKALVAFTAYSFLGTIFLVLLFITDSILLSFLMRRRDFTFTYQPGEIFKNNPEISKKNIGKYLKEGIMLNGPIKRGAHHDAENDLLIKSQGRKIIWLFGDSWGGGLKINENQNESKSINMNEIQSK